MKPEEMDRLIEEHRRPSKYENGEVESFFRTLKTEEIYALKAGSAL
jgi:transposase InsO family protein